MYKNYSFPPFPLRLGRSSAQLSSSLMFAGLILPCICRAITVQAAVVHFGSHVASLSAARVTHKSQSWCCGLYSLALEFSVYL